jgi:hypothetical protein
MIYKPRREALEEINPKKTLILDFNLHNGEKTNFCCGSYQTIVFGGGSPRRSSTSIHRLNFQSFWEKGIAQIPKQNTARRDMTCFSFR